MEKEIVKLYTDALLIRLKEIKQSDLEKHIANTPSPLNLEIKDASDCQHEDLNLLR